MDIIVKILWAIASSLIILISVILNKQLDFPQFKFKEYKKSFQCTNSGTGLSPKSTLFLTLAGRIGVGSIAGIALAIYIGGCGTVFWIWIISIISLPLSYAETVFANRFKIKYQNEYIGGPFYYIRNGLNKITLSKIYAFIIILSFLFGFLSIQVNTITKSLSIIVSFTKLSVGLIISFLLFIIIKGNIFRISNFINKIIPFMLLFYFLLGVSTIINNPQQVLKVLKLIIFDAFKIRPFFSGFLYKIIIGVQRGIFSSETGLGTCSITSCASSSLDTKKNGYLQMISVSITTLIVCTLTTIIILTSPYHLLNIKDPNGIEIALFAFAYHFSNFGKYFLIFLIFICAFSTILTGYYDSLVAFRYLFKNESVYKKILIFLTILMTILSSILSSVLIWQFVDILVAILIFINLYSIYKLKKYLKK